MTKVVHIVDYGVGNLYSVARAVEKAGGVARLCSDLDEIASADRLLLPGVGAYASCADTLRSHGLVEPILAFVERDRPFLAICVGMQLLFDYSLEFGRHAGLGFIAGHVERIPASDDGGSRKVPHVGWSTLHVPVTRSGWESTLLEGAAPAHSAAYFVHSYNCIPDDPSLCLADTDYDGFKVTAAVVKNNITGFQCHPEKSGELGLKIFGNFLNM